MLGMLGKLILKMDKLTKCKDELTSLAFTRHVD